MLQTIRYVTYIALLTVLCIDTNAQNLLWAEKSAPVSRETYAAVFSQDGKKIFSGSECGPTYLRVFDTYTGALQWESSVDSPLMCAQGVKFNSNGSKVATLEELGNLLIYDFTTPLPTLLNTVPLGPSYAFSVTFSPDGKKVAIGCSDKKLIIYDVDANKQLHYYDAHLNYVYGTDWSSKEQLATSGDDLQIKIWDTAGNLVRDWAAHNKAVVSVKFTPDGNKLVSASKDLTIKIWDVATGNLIRTLSGHTGELKQVDISDDGTKIVSGSTDGTIRVWDMATGNQVHSFSKLGSGTVFSVDFAPNSTRYVLAGTSNGDVQVWDLLFPASVASSAVHSGLDVYPNPAGNYISINVKGSIGAIQLSDVSGKQMNVLPEINGRNAYIDIAALPAGVYLLSVATNLRNETIKITKQ